MPLWPALLALFVSHGISFALNFLGRREYQHMTVQKLMAAPYGRIVMMQFTLIFGGWVVMLLNTPPDRAGVDDRAQGGRRSACTLRRTRGEEAVTGAVTKRVRPE